MKPRWYKVGVPKPLFGGQNGGQITKEQILTSVRESEFVNMVSRGKFDYPSEELFDLSLYLYSYYKSTEDKCCVNKILEFT